MDHRGPSRRSTESWSRQFGLIVVILMGVGAQQAQASDLLDIYRMAVEADPIFQAASLGHQASREILTQARSGYLPSVYADYDYSYTRQEILDSDNDLFQEGSEHYSTEVITLTLSQPLFRYGNIIRIRQAKSELKQADAEFEKSKRELMLRTAEVYIYALAADDHLDYLKSERNAVENQLALAEAKRRAEVGRVADVLEADARLAAVIADKSEAEVEYRDAYQAIYELTGEYPTDLKKLEPDFPLVAPDPLDEDQWVAAALEQNWEIAVQKEAVEVARQEVGRQNAGHYPTLDLELRENIKDQGGTVFGGGAEVENRDVMLSFKMPLYLGGSVSSKKREAVLLYEAERTELIGISRKVRRETEKGYRGVVNAIDRVRARLKEVAAQQEVLKLKRAGYEALLYSNMSVLDAEQDLYEAKRDLARARYEYLLNGLRLRAIVGTLSEAELVDLNQWLTRCGNEHCVESIDRP